MVSLLFVTLINTSCVPSKPTFEKKVLPADRLIKKIEANRRKIKSFEGNGTLDIKTPSLEARASFEISIKKPDSIKLGVYGPFGIDLAQALVTRNDFVFYDVMGDKAYTGNISTNVLKKIFRIDLPFNDLIDAFAGAVNLTGKLSEVPQDFEITDDYYFLTYTENATNMEFHYDINILDNALLRYQVVKKPDNLLFEGRYSEFEHFDNVPIPLRTVVENKKNNQALLIEYRNVSVNEEIEDLKLNLPDDVEIIRW